MTSLHHCLLLAFHAVAVSAAAVPVITHGPILGRPQPDSVRVWVRTSALSEFRILYGRTPEITKTSPSVVSTTTADADNTGFADLTGLQAAKTYWYAVEVKGSVMHDFHGDGKPLRFRTLASAKSFHHPQLNPQGRHNTTIGIAVCNHISGAKESPVYRNLAEKHSRDLDLFVMNGDYIYELGRKKIKPSEIDRDAARADYRAYLEGVPDMARFFAGTPMLFQFDDHEIGPEHATAEIGFKVTPKLRNAYTNPLLRDITLPAWTEYCGWANPTMPAYRPIVFGSALLEAGNPVLHDPGADFTVVTPENTSTLHIHMASTNGGVYAVDEVLDANRLKIRPAPGLSETAASYSIGTRHYYDFRMGSCHIFVLDTRSERTLYDAKLQNDPRQKVLGDAQTQWLMNGVTSSDADFILIVSPVSWMIYHNDSHMKGRPIDPSEAGKEDGLIGALSEREPLLDAFDKLKKPVVIFSGDLHSGYGIQITDNVWEFMISPVASSLHPVESGGSPPLQGLFDSNGRQVKIKWASTYPLSHTKEFRAQGRRHGFVYGLIRAKHIFPAGMDEKGVTLWKAYDTPSLQIEARDTESDEVVYSENISPLDSE